MDLWNRDELTAIVAEYESKTQNGVQVYFEEGTFLKLADFYIEDEDFVVAQEVIDYAIELYPFSPDLLLKKACLTTECGKPSEALTILDKAKVIAPSHKAIELLIAEVQIKLGNFEDSQLILNRLKHAAKGVFLSEILCVQAMLHGALGEHERMYFDLKQSVLENPRNEVAFFQLWTAIELAKKHFESVELHEQILDKDPYSHIAWYNLGLIQAYLGNYHEAIEDFEFSIVCKEDFDPAYADCAELCFEMKRYDKALDCYLELMNLRSPNEDTFFGAGKCCHMLGNLSKAKDFYRKALEIDHLNDEVFFHLAEIFAQEGGWKSAIKFYRKAISIENQREEYYAALAEAYAQVGDWEKAEINFKKALNLSKEESKCWVQLASFFIDQARFNDALELLLEADTWTVGPELNYCRAAALIGLGKRKEALYWLGEALEEDFQLFGTISRLIPILKNDAEITRFISEYC